MKSPCCKICKINDKQVCIGCNRDLVQIRDWSKYTNEKREKIMKQIRNKNLTESSSTW
jgi:uncharacterized protein